MLDSELKCVLGVWRLFMGENLYGCKLFFKVANDFRKQANFLGGIIFQKGYDLGLTSELKKDTL